MKSKNYVYMTETFASHEQLIKEFVFNELNPSYDERQIVTRKETYYDTESKEFLLNGGFLRYVEVTREDYSQKYYYEFKKNDEDKPIKIPFANGSPNLKYVEKLCRLEMPLIQQFKIVSDSFIYPITSHYGEEFPGKFKLVIDEVKLCSVYYTSRDERMRFAIFKDYTSPYKKSRSAQTVERILALENGFEKVDDNRYKAISDKIRRGFKPIHYR